MTPEAVGALSVAGLFILLALGVPVAYALAFSGFIGSIVISGLEPSLRVMGISLFSRVAYYPFSVIPLFMIMGYFAYYTGIVNDVFDVGRKWLGKVPGGLVQATIAGAAAFGAACGSGVASTAVLSKVCIPPMLEAGVDRRLAFGTVVGSGILAVMIPPSVTIAIYGIITEESIGKLLIAGVIPGVICATFFMTMVFVRAKRNPSLAPSLPKGVPWKDKLISLKGIWGIALLAIAVLGGIYTGVFTPTEAGGIGAFSTFALGLILRKLSWPNFMASLIETGKTTGMVFLIMACAGVFAYTMAISRLPYLVSELIISVGASPMLVIIPILILFLILGFFMDTIASMFIILPIVYPAIKSLGINPIWFGILAVHVCNLGLITPPYALNIFVLKGSVPEADVSEIIAGIWPFLFMSLLALAIFIVFPPVVTFLPGLMK